MAQVLVMPRQGNTVESCIIVRWRVAEGQAVAADAVACEVETDKATFDVPAGAAGVVLKLLRPEGDDVPVLSPIAVIGQPGEDWKAAAAAAGAAAGEAASPAPSAPASTPAPVSAPTPAPQPAGAEAPVSPRARRRAAAEAIEAAAVPGTGPGGRVIERDVIAAAAARPPLTAAARAAVAAGAPVPAAGTALGGRVGVADLAAARAAPPRPAAPADFPGPFTDTPLKGIRKLISERMLGSLSSTAQLTFQMSANAARLQALRARFKGSDAALGFTDVTIGDLVLYAVSRVLPRFPMANATLEKGVLRTFERVHLALAVDTPRGLMVPVIRNADQRSLRELSAEAKRLAAACQSGKIDPGELQGGTFTVTNLGAFGIESFTPVLYAPQVAILGVDAISLRAVQGKDGAVAFEPRIGLSLTVDHQVIDGAPAARILKGLADAVADVDLLLA